MFICSHSCQHKASIIPHTMSPATLLPSPPGHGGGGVGAQLFRCLPKQDKNYMTVMGRSIQQFPSALQQIIDRPLSLAYLFCSVDNRAMDRHLLLFFDCFCFLAHLHFHSLLICRYNWERSCASSPSIGIRSSSSIAVIFFGLK